MKTAVKLNECLKKIDRKGYKAYKEIQGHYDFHTYKLFIDHVQGDPFAKPSRIRVRVDRKKSGFPPFTTASKSRTVALCDYLTRRFYESCRKFSRGNRGSGKSGLITVDKPVQEILERSAMVINDQFVEARFFMGLPADGRRISARDAMAMFFDEVPAIVKAALHFKEREARTLRRHIETAEDADYIRSKLEEMNLVAFVAEGAVLPRASGIDPRPLSGEREVPFTSPPDFLREIDLPNHGKIKGMGIPKGVTLIVGGGFHGKSTLLNAIELGIYNHVPGDGREFVVSHPDTVKIRAADGRNIAQTDISSFITNLPLNKQTETFSTRNASGSTSQAANICEAMETGARIFLLDEDTCATNFMIRDALMQQLVDKKNEPITPFIDRVKQLSRDMGISTLLVMGGSGDYFKVADQVICMTDYVPHNATAQAKKIAENALDLRTPEGGPRFHPVRERIPHSDSFNPFRAPGRLKISANTPHEILMGRNTIEFPDIEQLVEISQTRAIAHAIHRASKLMNGRRTLSEVLDKVMEDIQNNGLETLTPEITGDLAMFRRHELAAAINRARTLVMSQK